MARGAVSKKNPGTRLLNFWAPSSLIRALNLAVKKTDLDRSKFIRAAIREKAAAQGFNISETV